MKLMIDQRLALAMLEGPCPHLLGQSWAKYDEWVTETGKCKLCNGTGRRYVLDPDGKLGLRVEKQGIWSHRDCKAMAHCQNLLSDDTAPRGITDCQGRGWTPTADLPTWMEAAANLNIIVTIRNDGPGWRCDLHRIDEHRIVTGWSDGGFTLDAPPKYRPYPLEALLNALAGVLLKGE